MNNQHTILLTSKGMKVPSMRDEVLKLISKPPQEIKLACINTASKNSSTSEWVIEDNEGLEKLGFNIEEIDIEGKTESELLGLLKDKDIIYVQGGDPFFLLKHIRLSGFDNVVKELMQKGVIYVGFSAGTYIACPSLEMALWHKPERERHGITDLTGMDLVPMLICVHFEESRREAYLQGMKSTKYQTKILNDEQSLLFKDGKCELVGNRKEISI